ncbi:MAG: PHP domain-containing protein [Chloroflexi bacterium]|nr:PHP domain-containing protein [Chloroflexota bacterium]
MAGDSRPADPRPIFPRDAPPAPPQGWGLAELHAHTCASDGVPSPGALVRRADALGMDVLAVTDHDTIDGALRARDIAAAADARVEIIVGMEVTTRRQDHVVGLFLERPVPIFRPLVETVEAIQAQGGLAIVAHPFLGVPTSISAKRLLRALAHVRFDGIETENQYFREGARAEARRFQETHAERVGAALGATDAHFGDLGRALTLFPGHTAAELRAAIGARATVPARGGVQHPRPALADHARNQYRSLVKLPVMRARTLWRQRRATGP